LSYDTRSTAPEDDKPGIPHKLEYKTVLYYKVILRYKTMFFGTARERTSILLYKTLFCIRNYII
jgi:hypothetical protein